MDDFAQTREADDLFDSEISAPPPPPPCAPTEPRAFSARGRGPGRGRGSFHQPRSEAKGASPKVGLPVSDTPEDSTAVFGEAVVKPQDRTLSGGLKKPKLTEEEMTARLERQKLHNKFLVDRRRKVEEDEDSFQVQEEARKQADASKRFVERKKKVDQERSRKELDDEREKNRQRKLSAACSREWDSTKTEEDYNPKNKSSRFRRGAYGAVTGPPTGPRRRSGGSPSKNPTSTQEWPDISPATKDKFLTKDRLSVGDGTLIQELIVRDAPLTNGKLVARDGEPKTENESEAEGKVSEKQRPDINDGDDVGDVLAPLSPAVCGGSWAEQVEANTQ